ncbi:hypothetical protein AAFF_G00087950 [Aldrovandia affinis]|uniref:Uncharacterized protein n=1 Tax=Aldrovandia affinis TaxID=143900 RepID=A0AAD7RWN7_9TELE|nr:hypothetical protein AAFF_G00087950 [Aldrovandia affinis]
MAVTSSTLKRYGNFLLTTFTVLLGRFRRPMYDGYGKGKTRGSRENGSRFSSVKDKFSEPLIGSRCVEDSQGLRGSMPN